MGHGKRKKKKRRNPNGHVSEEDGGLDDLIKVRSTSLEDGTHVFEATTGLGGSISFEHLHGLQKKKKKKKTCNKVGREGKEKGEVQIKDVSRRKVMRVRESRSARSSKKAFLFFFFFFFFFWAPNLRNERDATTDKEEAVGLDGLAVRADCGGGKRGGDDFAAHFDSFCWGRGGFRGHETGAVVGKS